MAADHVALPEKKLRAGWTLVFEDESGFSTTPFVARTWAPVGQTPVLVHPWNWSKLSAASAVAVRLRRGRLKARLYFRLFPGKTIKGPEIVAFLRPLARHVRGPVALVWDGAPQHRGKRVKGFLAGLPRFAAVPLPPYCPELNADEGVWNWVKTKDQANVSALHDYDLIDRIWGSLKRMSLREDLLVGCLKATDLTWGGVLDD